MENNIDWNNTAHNTRIKFIVPVGSNKKWWQFWKKNEKQAVEKIFMDSFGKDIKKDIENHENKIL